ncbi:hypothetical protein [Paenibacillus sedimenti]|uniref:Uncharacterized protein n=1 Tax=Paenibacillus sedimenti TaxID=2770274 RepID=A0A926KVE5_9BACL|nr:hypothetical protein [Paenibacillus sedimenti]MBD0384750.1 hypothetical protein [Paenibacillus sedimenti]
MTMDMNYSDQYIGYYRMMFNFAGEAIDDFLVSEWKTWEIYRRISILEEIKNDIKNEELLQIIEMKIQETKKKF